VGVCKARRVATPASRAALAAGVIALAGVLGSLAAPCPAVAQANLSDQVKVPAGTRMVLQADELIYDRNADTVTASGQVRISYGGYRLVADSVTYNQKTGRMLANGNVELVPPDGNKVYAQHVDVTNDFRDGFVNALRVDTPQNTHFAAATAERTGGTVTTFQNGVYTPCEPCREHPEKPPFWQVKSQRIIWNEQQQTIRFENARFEFFGQPIAYLPYFVMPGPSAKRKTGFLFPHFHYKSDLGFGIGIPYYLALAPSYDLTITETGYTKQGFLTEAEWRQRFANGLYDVRVAGIHQMDPGAFPAGTVEHDQENRGFIASKGRFDINPRWAFGWDVIAQSDKDFARIYDIEGYSQTRLTSQAYLTGLSGRNYFDLHAYKFDFQESLPSSSPDAIDPTEPWVLPSLDYAYIPTMPVAGGELDLNLNARSLYRDREDFDTVTPHDRMLGVEGMNSRLTAQAAWRRSFITPGGLVLTPLLSFRGDAFYLDQDAQASANAYLPSGAVARAEAYRYMATAGLDMRWPILFSTTSATHIIEPEAQIFLRNNEQYIGELPNEDAQSFVFDASTLFEEDKFAGYDRMEGGDRANVGVRYSGTFANGWTADALFGQSYQLGGLNSFATPDFVHSTGGSGLETSVSDFVGMAGLSDQDLTLALRGRFDHETFAVRRAEIAAQMNFAAGSGSIQYAFIGARPEYGYVDDRHQVTVSTKLKVNADWRVFGSGTYDFVSSQLVRDSVGFSYENSCFVYGMQLTQSRWNGTDTTTVGVTINLRTLGDANGPQSAAALN